MTLRLIMTLVLAASAVGCANLSPEPAFTDVRQQVLSRTGQQVQWRRDEDGADVRRLISSLLVDELTADKAVQVALVNNRAIQAVYEELGVRQAELVQAGLLRNPMLSGSVKIALTGPGPEVEMTLAQEFLQILFIPLKKAVAEAELEAAKLRITGEVMSVIAATRLGFYDVQAAAQTMEMLDHVSRATAASYVAMQRIHAAGNVPELDLVNERVLHEQAKLDLAAAQLRYEVAREHLTGLMGLWGADTAWKIAARLPDPPATMPVLEGLEAKAVASSIDLALARQDVESYGRRVGLSKASTLIPQLELGAATKREAHGEWLLGPAFTLPLPLFDQGEARVAGAQAELRRRQQLYVQRAVEVRSALRAARQRLLSAHRIVQHYRGVILPLREQAVQQTQLQYNAMQVGVFQLLLAKREQIQAGARYINALHAYWVAQTELQTIVQGRMSDLKTDVAALLTPSTETMETSRGGH